MYILYYGGICTFNKRMFNLKTSFGTVNYIKLLFYVL